MPPNTLRVHTEYVLVKSVASKVLWADSLAYGTGEYFPPLQFHAKSAEIGSVAIYRPFEEFHRANSYCHLRYASNNSVRLPSIGLYAANNNINILDTLQNSRIRMIVKATRYMRNDDIGQPIEISVHFTQHLIREQPLSSHPSQTLKKLSRPDEEPKPRLPDPIIRPIPVMPFSRIQNTTFVMPNTTDYPDMGLRTVLRSGCPKSNAYSTHRESGARSHSSCQHADTEMPPGKIERCAVQDKIRHLLPGLTAPGIPRSRD
ncbi:uncharacterized protein TNCV_2885461 [Trichonephila clavipes]|nr:uncharacterized protein TNCV_2885461 [Trichonephila clavipes]